MQNSTIQRIEKDFSQDFEIYTLLTNELRLATLYDLQAKYNTEDLYDLLEIMDVTLALDEVKAKQLELEKAAARPY